MSINEVGNEKEITFDEFKAWLNGMVYGKGTNLPDFHDWKLIKQMMERVVPDKVEIQNPYIAPTPLTKPAPYIPPDPYRWEPTCDSGGSILPTTSEIHSAVIGNAITNEGLSGKTNEALPCPMVFASVNNSRPALSNAQDLLEKFKKGSE